MTKEEVFNLIRQRLSFGDELQQQLRHVDKDKFMKEHRRFEMSGFETQTGWCTVFNNDILNKFADKYFSEDENLEYTLDGYTTTEIIFTIFELTIFSGKPTRRRK